MTRIEFLDKLKTSLGNDLNSADVQENVRYYDEYITGEVNKGRSEAEVIDELGDPWVVARSVVNSLEDQKDMEGGRRTASEGYGDYSGHGNYGNTEYSYGSNDEYGYNDNGESGKQNFGQGPLGFLDYLGFDVWWKKALLIAGIVLVVIVVVAIFMGILSILIPMLIPLAIIIFVANLFFGGGRGGRGGEF